MKNNNSSKFELLKINLTWWILGLVLAFPTMFFIEYFTGRIYPPQMDDFLGYARGQQLRLELIVLSFLNLITPVFINVVEIFGNNRTRKNIKKETNTRYFNFPYHLDDIKRPVPYILAVILIVVENAFIISMMMYLRQHYYTGLNNSMESFLGFPGPMIIVSSLLLVIDCSLIFCVLLFSFLWGYSWVQWAADKIFPRFSDTKYYSPTILLASLIFRALNMWGLALLINLVTTFSGKFNTMNNIIFGITILLILWLGVYLIPYWRENIILKKNSIVLE
jgi:hypothetical protein